MFKKICMATLAALAAQASMAADVQIFGAIDQFIAIDRTGSKTSVALKSGGVDASHVGIRGTEDIADGVQVYFQADSAFQSDNGSFSIGSGDKGLFNRQVELGVRGTYGQLSFGRLYTPHFLTFLFYDPTGLSIGSSYSGYFMAGPHSTCGTNGELVRASNSISYMLPTSFGLTNFFFATLGEQTKDNGRNSSSRGNIYNYAAKYDNGAFSAMGSFLIEKRMRSTSGLNWYSGEYDDKYFNMAVSYDFGAVKPVFQFMKKWTTGDNAGKTTANVASSDLWLIQIGASAPFMGGKFMTSATYLKNQTREKANSYAFGMKYNYPLSKRTTVYVGYQGIKNQKNSGYQVEAGPDSSTHFNWSAQDAFGNSNGYAVPASALGKNVHQVFFGLSHQF